MTYVSYGTVAEMIDKHSIDGRTDALEFLLVVTLKFAELLLVAVNLTDGICHANTPT